MAQQILSTNTFTTAKWIVSATASDGTHTTIATALTAASSGDTIFIRPGTYTENLTLKAGVCLTAYQCDSSAAASTGNVTIIGKATFTAAGTVNISGINLQTNSDFVLAVTGSANSIVNLNNCFINAINNTAISYTTSGTGSQITLYYCRGSLGTTGIAIFAHSAGGNLLMDTCIFNNPGASLTASTCSAGSVTLLSTYLGSAVTMSSTGHITIKYTEIDVSTLNITALTTVGADFATYVHLWSGTATPLVVSSSTLVAAFLFLYSTNATAVSGSGTLIYAALSQLQTIGAISCTTITPKGVQGMISSTAPSAGIIGELVTASVTTPTTLAVNTITNVTSITPTAGIWEITAAIQYNVGTGVGMQNAEGCIATANNNFTPIDNFGGNVSCGLGNLPFGEATASPCVVIGPCRLSTTGSTVVYLNAFLAGTSAGTRTYAGVIRAVRVA